ncbi:MAG: DinB family protein, partial [Candidatus Thorarchaeota archaeon]
MLIKMLSDGLYGKYTHLDPKKAINGLTAEIASKKPKGNSHSCWELLYHMVAWQDFALRSLDGEEVTWDEIVAKEWPSDETATFDELKSTFIEGLDKLVAAIESKDLE